MKKAILFGVVAAVLAASVFIYFKGAPAEEVDLFVIAGEYCKDEGVGTVNVSKRNELIQIIPLDVGAAVAYYGPDGAQRFECPIVNELDMTQSCFDALAMSDWQQVCRNEVAGPTLEDAEKTTLDFALNVIKLMPPVSDVAIEEEVYNTLSTRAQQQVGRRSINADLLTFFGFTQMPLGVVSVVDIRATDEQRARAMIVFNDNGTEEVRLVDVVLESNTWRVDEVTTPLLLE